MLVALTTLGVSAAAAAAYAGYASMAPGPQLFGRTVTHGSDPTQMALTYDDGPNDPHTLNLLDVLDKHNARATFFLIGKYVRQRPEIARAIQSAGHVIGNHTYSHPNLVFVSAARVRRELDDCRKALEDAIGKPAPLFRPPFGGRRPAVLKTVRSLGLTPIMWSITGFDWDAKSSQAIVHKIDTALASRRKSQGEIVLLHDGGHRAFGADRSHTVEATRTVLETYPRMKFVAIPELQQ